LFDRPKGGERAALVQISSPDVNSEDDLQEFQELARAADAEIITTLIGARVHPEPKYYIGLGKAEQLRDAIVEHEIEIVLVNHDLSPSQARNLEKLVQCRVVDRSGLILDIFARRARTFEGKLQVELAQLEHLSTRLIRGWTHLERQKGGIGLRGPGETQLETDRRLIRERIKFINKRLAKVRQSRDQNRRARKKATMPTISLVGYTNAGKSSLFNALTGDAIFAANMLFATLDPTMRKIELPGAQPAILTDTVGFIRDLPHQLVNAFHATLEETQEADLLLHVIDLANPHWREHVSAVEKVLEEIGADKVRMIQVFNKIDCIEGLESQEQTEGIVKVWVSALSGQGLDVLKDRVAQMLNGELCEETVILSSEEGKLRAKLYAMKAVISETITEEGLSALKIRITKAEKAMLFPID
jgi:GTP-binding protein HflX